MQGKRANSTTGRSASFNEHLDRFSNQLRTFWERVSEGLEVQELWARFRSDASASYQLYSREVDWGRSKGEPHWKRTLRITRSLFWAMILKLTPPRRVLLLIALVLLLFPGFEITSRSDLSPVEIKVTNFHFLGGVALFVLLALELADRVTMKRDLEIAREIQQWLVPTEPPRVPGIDLAFATRPANTVAGDYYDAFLRRVPGSPSAVEPQQNNRLLLAVADVAGKSVPASLLMATFQASLRTLADAGTSLVELVAGLNHYACQHSLGGRRFTTAFLAELEPATRAISYVNAGHNLPVLRRAAGGIERLEAGGLPLGIKADERYESGAAVLQPGDLLVIFTDGVVEAQNEKGEEFGEARFLDALSRPAGVVGSSSSPKEVATPASAPDVAAVDLKRLLSAVDAFVGSARQHDDITCLVLRCLPA